MESKDHVLVDGVPMRPDDGVAVTPFSFPTVKTDPSVTDSLTKVTDLLDKIVVTDSIVDALADAGLINQGDVKKVTSLSSSDEQNEPEEELFLEPEEEEDDVAISSDLTFSFTSGHVIPKSKIPTSWGRCMVLTGRVISLEPLEISWSLPSPFYVSHCEYDQYYGGSTVYIGQEIQTVTGVFPGYVYHPTHGALYTETKSVTLNTRLMSLLHPM